MTHPAQLLRLLVIDDEQPALDELEFLLGRDDRVGSVRTCDSATEALRLLRETEVDGVFLDIQMPGLSGLELAGVLANFRSPPPVVFVTAHDEHAVDAFELDALDYVLKPVREERLAEAVRRVLAASRTEHTEEQGREVSAQDRHRDEERVFRLRRDEQRPGGEHDPVAHVVDERRGQEPAKASAEPRWDDGLGRPGDE